MMNLLNSDITQLSQPKHFDRAKSIQIGVYDEGLGDLADPVTIKYQTSVSGKDEALKHAQKTPESDVVVERRTENGELTYDIYELTVHDKKRGVHTLQNAKNIELFDRPLDIVEKQTVTKGSIPKRIENSIHC